MPGLARATCGDCGTSFVTAHHDLMRMLEPEELASVEERCPHCGAIHRYRLGDYYRLLEGRRTPLVRARIEVGSH